MVIVLSTDTSWIAWDKNPTSQIVISLIAVPALWIVSVYNVIVPLWVRIVRP